MAQSDHKVTRMSRQAECKTMAFKRNLLQEKFKRLTLNQFRELMSEIRQGVPGKYEEYENPGCSSRIQKWTLSTN